MSGIVVFLSDQLQRLNSVISAPLNITGLPSPHCSGAGAGGAGAGGAAVGGTAAGGRVWAPWQSRLFQAHYLTSLDFCNGWTSHCMEVMIVSSENGHEIPLIDLVQLQMINPVASNQVMRLVAWFPCFLCIEVSGAVWVCYNETRLVPLPIDTPWIPIKHWK